MSVCQHCGAALPPQTGGGRRRKWCDDTCRRQLYRGHCVDCGARTYNGTPEPPTRCVPCSNVVLGAARKVWTRDKLINAIRRWETSHGEPPRATNWSPTVARHIGHPELAAEYVAGRARGDVVGEWPHTMSVIGEFGTWNAAIAAAGFHPRPAHHRGLERAA